jgi:hypothetical protein
VPDAAGECDGVDSLDRHGGIEQRAFPSARPAAANVRGCDRGLIEQHDGRARAELVVVGMPDADAGNIGDEISCQSQASNGRGTNHSRSTADHISASSIRSACARAPRHASRLR